MDNKENINFHYFKNLPKNDIDNNEYKLYINVKNLYIMDKTIRYLLFYIKSSLLREIIIKIKQNTMLIYPLYNIFTNSYDIKKCNLLYCGNCLLYYINQRLFKYYDQI